MTKKTWGLLLIVVGAVAIGIAFYMQAQLNSASVVAELTGRRASGSPGPWFMGGVGVLAILAGIVLLATGSRPPVVATPPATPAVPMGWHDDPESPSRLRYHDGTKWTDRTAEKS